MVLGSILLIVFVRLLTKAGVLHPSAGHDDAKGDGAQVNLAQARSRVELAMLVGS